MGDPTATVTAEGPIAFVACIGLPSHLMWCSGGELEGVFGDRCRESEGAARDSLAIGAMTGIDHQWRCDDLVSQGAALASARNWELDISSHGDRFFIPVRPQP